MDEQKVQEGSGGRKSGAGKKIVTGVVIAAAIVLAGAVVIRLSGAGTKSQALLSVLELLDGESVGVNLNVSADINGQEIVVAAQVCSAETEEGIPVYKITYSGLSFYYAEGAIFLEDGTAYRLTGTSGDAEDTEESDSFSFVLDYTTILSLLKTYYADTSAQITTEEDVTIYSIELNEENSLELLEVLYAPAAGLVNEMGALTVDLYVQDGAASAAVIRGGAAVDTGTPEDGAEADGDSQTESGGEGMLFSIDARIDILTGEEGTFAIPDAVQSAIAGGDYEDAAVLSEELFRLVAAWNALSGQDTIGADIGIGADFGLFSLYEELNWVRTPDEDGTAVNVMKINGHTFYFTDDGTTYDLSGVSGAEDSGEDAQTEDSLTEDEETAASIDPLFLLEIAYDVFMNGGVSFSEEGGDYIYMVSLTQEQMETIVLAMIPDAENLDIAYEDGLFTAVVTDSAFTSLSLTCGGEVSILFASVSIDLEIEVDFMDAEELADFALPLQQSDAA